MEVNEARKRLHVQAMAFARKQVANGYSIVCIAYDNRQKYVDQDRCWLVIYG